MLKRGISPLITTVLLVGFTFVIGIMVFGFGLDVINKLMSRELPSTQINQLPTQEETVQEEQEPITAVTPITNTIEYANIDTYEEKYIYAHDLLALNKDNSIVYLTKDYLGSTRAVSDSNGNVVYSQGYYPYGSEINTNKDDVSYSGKQLDKDTELYYYGARYYNPIIGRFTQLDPVDSSNSPYMAFNNNPMKYVDPDGRDFEFAGRYGETYKVKQNIYFERSILPYFKVTKTILSDPYFLEKLNERVLSGDILFMNKVYYNPLMEIPSGEYSVEDPNRVVFSETDKYFALLVKNTPPNKINKMLGWVFDKMGINPGEDDSYIFDKIPTIRIYAGSNSDLMNFANLYHELLHESKVFSSKDKNEEHYLIHKEVGRVLLDITGFENIRDLEMYLLETEGDDIADIGPAYRMTLEEYKEWNE